MTLKAILVPTSIVILSVTGFAAAQPDAARPTIHRVTVDGQSGVLTITGAGLGAHLIVSVEGTAVAVLAGATDTQVEVVPPPAVLTTLGTYRLTVMDPVRQIGDAFRGGQPTRNNRPHRNPQQHGRRRVKRSTGPRRNLGR